jgi:hypothetical protein
MKRAFESDTQQPSETAVPPEPISEAVEAVPEVPPEPEDKEYTVKPGCAIEHGGIRYEGNTDNPVKVKLSKADAEVHSLNLE